MAKSNVDPAGELYEFVADVTVQELHRAFCKGDVVRCTPDELKRVDAHYAERNTDGKAYVAYQGAVPEGAEA